jgi:hypothetical protein
MSAFMSGERLAALSAIARGSDDRRYSAERRISIITSFRRKKGNVQGGL